MEIAAGTAQPHVAFPGPRGTSRAVVPLPSTGRGYQLHHVVPLFPPQWPPPVRPALLGLDGLYRTAGPLVLAGAGFLDLKKNTKKTFLQQFHIDIGIHARAQCYLPTMRNIFLVVYTPCLTHVTICNLY